MSLALMNTCTSTSRRRSLTRKLKAAVKDLIQAEIADSWKGGGDPAEIPYIEADLVKAKARYQKVLAEVQGALN